MTIVQDTPAMLTRHESSEFCQLIKIQPFAIANNVPLVGATAKPDQDGDVYLVDVGGIVSGKTMSFIVVHQWHLYFEIEV